MDDGYAGWDGDRYEELTSTQRSMIWALYIASAFGAVSLYLMMPRAGYNPRAFGALLGAMALGGVWLWLSRFMPAEGGGGLPSGALPYYYIFSGLAIAAAVRVITHTKPVYAALWFVIVALASAGLLVVLAAPFMAVAMVIIYGGAILVTYVFVIMLAAQAGDAADQDAAPAYDRVAREPLAAIVAGFVLLAVLLSVAFADHDGLQPPAPGAAGAREAALLDEVLVNRAPNQMLARPLPAAEQHEQLALAQNLDNVELVGVDLFRSHPLGIELAGVILLVSLVGAVVIARTHVPEEDELANAEADASGASVRG